MAAKARRDAHAGRLSEAAAAYQELLGTRFEPEATAGLTRILGRLAGQQAAAGEVQQVKELTERMTALGHVSRAEVATTVASALEQSGRRSQAREQLEAAIATATDDRERTKLHQRAGGLALAEDDLDDAAEHFQAALEIARDVRRARPHRPGADQDGAHRHPARRSGGRARAPARGGARVEGGRGRRAGGSAPRASCTGCGACAAVAGRMQRAERSKMVEQAVDPKGSPAELEPLRRELGIV